jgi:hypothetical protein
MDRRANKRTTLGSLLFPTTEAILLLGTHGWWPWLLLCAAILAVVAYAVVFFMKRRRAS